MEENECWVETCVYCNKIEIGDQPVYCRTDFSLCEICGGEDFVLIDANEALKGIGGMYE